MSKQVYYASSKKRKKSVSSRLVKKEQKKLTQQTFVLAALALVILALFLFVLMPVAIRLFFKIIDGDTILVQTDDMPPQIPVIEAPVDATNSASVKLHGFAEPESEVVFVLNHQETDRVQADSEGKFSYILGLVKGSNNLVFYGVDEVGNESTESKNYFILMDNEEPIIELENPEDGAKIELKKNQVLEVKGKTEPKSKVTVNGRIVYANSEGEFKLRYQLQEGENKLEIEVTDKAGNKAKVVRTVHFKL